MSKVTVKAFPELIIDRKAMVFSLFIWRKSGRASISMRVAAIFQTRPVSEMLYAL